LKRVKSFDISAEVIESEWSLTITDGNRIGIRDEVSFEGKSMPDKLLNIEA
jgi:hypothetical protein